MTRVLELVRAHGKQPVGWEEIAKVPLPPDAIVQHWKNEKLARAAVRQGARVIMSPATRTYLDMKYDATTKLGLEWAGYISVRDASDWDPATQVEGVAESDVLGVEACLWSETLETFADVEYMAFPRLFGIAARTGPPRLRSVRPRPRLGTASAASESRNECEPGNTTTDAERTDDEEQRRARTPT